MYAYPNNSGVFAVVSSLIFNVCNHSNNGNKGRLEIRYLVPSMQRNACGSLWKLSIIVAGLQPKVGYIGRFFKTPQYRIS